MVDAAFVTTLAFALTAGLATFFSPCAYPLLPGYVGYCLSRLDDDEATLGPALVRGLVAGSGVVATFGVLLGLAFTVGHAAFSNVVLLEPVAGLVLVGLGVLVVLDRAPTFTVPLPERRSSVLGFGLFGAGYALAAAGCVIPVVLAVLARALSMPPTGAAVVIGTYVGGMAVLMVALTVATGIGLGAGAKRFAAYTRQFERLAGVVMILAGFGQLYLGLTFTNVI
jgi:cytochrome c-type biogenesis protein